MHSIKGTVHGRVQGVGFRYFVRTVAQRHGDEVNLDAPRDLTPSQGFATG